MFKHFEKLDKNTKIWMINKKLYRGIVIFLLGLVWSFNPLWMPWLFMIIGAILFLNGLYLKMKM
jgi:hypothetical protein